MKITRVNCDDIKLSRNPFFNFEAKNWEDMSTFAIRTIPKYKKVSENLQSISSVLENYARENGIKIKFKYDPSSLKKEDHRLNIIVTDDGFMRGYNSIEKSISPDTDTVTVYKEDKNHTYEDTFARRVFRAVGELTESVRNKRKKDERDYIRNMLEMQRYYMPLYPSI